MAADYPTDKFLVVGDDVDEYTRGTITWYNRTANIQGTMEDGRRDDAPVTAYFEAYAGSTKIDSTTRTANINGDLGSFRDFNFTIGDSDLVGGIDRIKITVCREKSLTNTVRVCSDPQNYSKS